MGINPLSAFPEHFMLNYKNRGASKALVGDVVFYFFMVNDSDSKWDEKSIQDFKAVCNRAISSLEAQARSYGARLNIKYAFDTASTDEKINNSNWRSITDKALSKYSFKDVDGFQAYYEDKYKLDDSCIILAFNKRLRGFAAVSTKGYADVGECCFVGSGRYVSIMHEVLHQFGAKDYYYPEQVKASARLHFKDSVMMSANCEKVDRLTAYLVGWVDDLDRPSEAFLSATRHYTQKDIDDIIRTELKK